MSKACDMDVDEPTIKKPSLRSQLPTKVSSSEVRARNAIDISESSASTPSISRKRVLISNEVPVDKSKGRAKCQVQKPKDRPAMYEVYQFLRTIRQKFSTKNEESPLFDDDDMDYGDELIVASGRRQTFCERF
ncbi:hypothetical protein L7F22_001649 [Adiantum nelumboides]|nr:hypothetical protein [Adiantum nelumboides]